MMKRYPFWGALGFLILLSGALPCIAQKRKSTSRPNTSTAKTLDETLQKAMRLAPPSNDNDYMRLLDLGELTVKPDGTTVGVYRETYKLFTERARPLAEVSLPYNSSYQTTKLIKAQTIKRDGTVMVVKPADVRVSSPYSDYLMYDDAVSLGFSMPGIENGCVIDYTYEVTTRPLLMAGQFWAYWGFSDIVPVEISRYSLTLPQEKPIFHKTYNDSTLKPTIVRHPTSKTVTYTWERKNLDPIIREPAMPPTHEVRVWLEATSLPSWNSIANWYWGLAKPQSTANAAIRMTVTKLTEGKKTPEEKAQAIYDWVANRTRYVGLEFGLSAFKPHSASDVHKNLYGDCKDKATLLITMLGLAGIEAHPVLLKADSQTRTAQGLPTLTAFNHCIAWAQINGKEYWLDATAETCSFGDIPAADRGVEALVVYNGKGEFKTIPSYSLAANGTYFTSHVQLKKDGNANVDLQIRMVGGLAQQMHYALRSINPTRHKEFAQQVALRIFSGAVLETYTLPSITEKRSDFQMSMKFSVPAYAETAGNLLLIPSTLGTPQSNQSHPFTQESRQWSVVETENTKTQAEITIDIPEGYQLDSKLLDSNLDCPLQAYHRTVRKSDNKPQLQIVEILEQKAGRMPPSQYQKLKEFYNQLTAANKSRLVLKEAIP